MPSRHNLEWELVCFPSDCPLGMKPKKNEKHFSLPSPTLQSGTDYLRD